MDAVYCAEVEQVVKALTGADLVALLGYVLRTSGTTSAETQPPASEVHVDMTPDRAVRLAATMYEKSFCRPSRLSSIHRQQFVASILATPSGLATGGLRRDERGQ